VAAWLQRCIAGARVSHLREWILPQRKIFAFVALSS
jgi:hypothetical protein